MKCCYQELLSVLPVSWRDRLREVDLGKVTEIRLRLGQRVELVQGTAGTFLPLTVQSQDIQFCINTASRYSPWTNPSLHQGYITAPGGHRMGLCGSANLRHGGVQALQEPTSVCIRVARDFPGCSSGFLPKESVLLLGPPGCGKTTFLRDLIRQIGQTQAISVVDERMELFPLTPTGFAFPPGPRTDVLSGWDKAQGTAQLLRTMGPAWIAMDEITGQEDVQALLNCAWCGVHLLATAHASSLEDLCCRPIYRPLWDSGVFTQVYLFSRDNLYKPERRTIP